MKAWAFVFSLLWVSSAGFGAEGRSIRYDELKDLIQKNNKAVRASLEGVDAAKLRVGTIHRSFLPRAGFEAGVSEEKEANGLGTTAPFWKIDIQANVYRGGRDRVGLLQRDSQVLIKEMNTQALYRGELFKAKSDYVQLAMLRQVIDLTQSSMNDYDGLQKSIRRKSRAGLMTDTAVKNIQLEVDDLKRQLIVLEGEEHELEDRLNLILGIEVDQSIKLLTNFPVSSLETKALEGELKVEGMPEVQSLSLLSKSVQLETQTQNEWWRPEVSLFASYTGYDVKRQNEFASLPGQEMSVGVRLSIDLEARSALDSEVSAKRVEILSLESQKEYLSREIDHKIHEYRREIETQTSLIKSYDIGLVNSKKLLKQLNGEFERGLVGSDEVSVIIHSIYELRRNRIESLSSYFLARAGLETMTDLEAML